MKDSLPVMLAMFMALVLPAIMALSPDMSSKSTQNAAIPDKHQIELFSILLRPAFAMAGHDYLPAGAAGCVAVRTEYDRERSVSPRSSQQLA